MKSARRKWLSIALRLSLNAAALYLLCRAGVNPILSVLAILYWKTVIALGIIFIGLAYYAHTIMN